MIRHAWLLAAAPAVLAGAGMLLPRCAPRVPLATPMPVPAAQAIASSSAAVVGTQSMRVTIRRTVGRNGAPTASQQAAAQDALEGPLPAIQVSQDPGKQAVSDNQDEEIIIELSQAVTSGASSSAAASASVDQFRQVAEMIPNHGRLSVLLGTMPGLVALDVELLRVDVPPWLLGVPLEMGLDLAGNLETGALGVSVGGKAYAMAGAWSTWRGDQQGLLLGVGMRF